MRQVTISGHILAFRLAMLAVLLSAIALATAWPVLSAERERAVEIKLFSFPKTLEVTEGTRVVWTNRDAIEHSVTAHRTRPGSPSTPDCSCRARASIIASTRRASSPTSAPVTNPCAAWSR
jgi:plastocyanin